MADGQLDLVVIGAGPHALSLLARLIDDEPDLLTERERVTVAKKAGTKGRSHGTIRKHLKRKFNAAERLPRVVVIDAHGRFMAQWEADFAALDIRHTRSHADLHPCPYDFASLRVWAEMHHRQDELVHMVHLQREAARAKGYGGPFNLPGSRLFLDFCASLVERYGLAPLVRQGFVEDVKAVPSAIEGGSCTFEVRLSDGTRLAARRVVCAMGPGPMFAGMRATLPWWAEDLAASLANAPVEATNASTIVPSSRMQHSSQLTSWLRQADVEAHAALSDRRILIVGGGQTAAHLALLAARRGASRVTILARRRITRKPYDVDLEAVGDRRAQVLGQFWKLDEPCARLQFIAALRGGGSMSDDVYHELLKYAADAADDTEASGAADGTVAAVRASAEAPAQEGAGVHGGGGPRGRLDILEEVEVSEASWRPHEPGGKPDGAGGGQIVVGFDDGRDAAFDYVWLATGGNLDLGLVPILASMHTQRPIDTANGLPVLRPDLSWDAGCPLYVMGAFAQLELGADALNLAGARSGSVLVAKALLEAADDDKIARQVPVS